MNWKTIRDHVALSFDEIELTGQLQHDPTQHALVLAFDDGDSEVLSIDLLSSGYVAFPGEVFVRDYSEHFELPAALVEAGVCEAVEEIQLRPHGSRVQRMRVIERATPLVFPTAESHSQQAVLLPVTEQRIAEAHGAAVDAAHGDSNDEEIERLWELVEVLLGALQIEGEARP
ncbi:hypothetical protein [Leucobacter luti]|uniref:Uncharacterized protein n=1 Tax=Leucobacter luti TaxID=340320 RepID=A0A4Q7TYV9_9MICO|nr:hypothetical protein [Leucobacter luti]MBL3698993.1 hypothetical protein [Leucobacter luti]RZT66371.1 hypothetical protein EV139_1808 [Leucobacter luti]